MFDKRSDIIRFLTVADTGGIGLAADRLEMTQPALTRVIARLEREFDGKLFERLPKGVRLTSLGTTAAEVAKRILTEIEAAEEQLDATHSGRAGIFRITAGPVWSSAVLPEVIARFHESFPRIELKVETTTRAEGLRRLARGDTDLHCGGIDGGERIPDFLRREHCVDLTAGIVAHGDHPLLARSIFLRRPRPMPLDRLRLTHRVPTRPNPDVLVGPVRTTPRAHQRPGPDHHSCKRRQPVPHGKRPVSVLVVAAVSRPARRSGSATPAGIVRAYELPLGIRGATLRRGFAAVSLF